MRRMIPMQKPVALILILALLTVVSGLGPAYASMVGTSEVLEQESRNLDRERVLSALQRDRVQQKLRSWGVDPHAARARVQALTDRELARIARDLERQPAGGDGLSTLVGGAIFVFLVLLITDIAGLTNVFSFVKK